MAERRKVTEDEARRLVVEWRGSGRALPAWCAARGIDGRSLRSCAGRLDEPAALRVVEMGAPSSTSCAEPIRLRVNEVTVSVGASFSEEALTRVLRAVRGC